LSPIRFLTGRLPLQQDGCDAIAFARGRLEALSMGDRQLSPSPNNLGTLVACTVYLGYLLF